ncbi:hypothetical protein AB5N19_02391 [Seiridium cardinale]
MAPTMRTTQTRRGNRAGYQEHDDFEGLPVRQWRQEWVSIAPPPQIETAQKNDVWAIELPHGMPKDSNLLPTHTQELLRAARSGRLYKRPAPVEEEEAEADAAPEKPEKKEEDPSTKGYMVKVWKQIPRNAEGPTISHLAKRRKGTVTLSAALPSGNTAGPTVTKATVRRIDAAGNPYNQEVILAAGQPVDGEIISTTVVQAPSANVSADNTAATQVRRRPPPPKRKAKGPGRGRKKKLLPLPGPSVTQSGAPGVEGGEGGMKPDGAADGIKQEGGSDNQRQDSEMADGDDDDEGDDDGDEGDEGEEGDEDDGEILESEKGTPARKEGSLDQEIKHSPSVDPPAITAPTLDSDAMDISVDEPGIPTPQVQPSAILPPIQPPNSILPNYEGSPLKNVLIPSPTEPTKPATPSLPPVAGTSAPSQPSTSATSVPEMIVPESEVPELDSSLRSEPILAPLPSVEAPPTVTETIAQETMPSELLVSADTEMTDVAPTQPDTVIESKILSSTDTETGQTVVEEIIETTTVPLNDEAPLTEPLVVEEVVNAPEELPPQSQPEVTKIPSPVIQEPVDFIQKPAIAVQESVEPAREIQEESIQGSINPIQGPFNPIQEPINPVQEPVEPAQEPVLPIHEPIESAQVPVEDIQEPVESFQEPVIPTQQPNPSALPQQNELRLASPVTQITEVTELSAAPATEVSTTKVDVVETPATILPALNPLQTEAPAPIPAPAPLTDEREPESPDLLGGLAAALDRHSESRNEQRIDTLPALSPPPTVAAAQPPVAEPVLVEVVSTGLRPQEMPEEKPDEKSEAVGE